jgi:hypothetical protein
MSDLRSFQRADGAGKITVSGLTGAVQVSPDIAK